MDTQAINNSMNDLFFGFTDKSKTSDGGDFLKTFESAGNCDDIKKVAERNINPIDELTVKREYENNKVDNLNGINKHSVKESSVESVDGSEKVNLKTKNTDDLSEEDIDFLEENYESILNAYSEILGIPVEQVAQFFEDNDYKLSDVLSPENVNEIVLGLEGISDSSEILTNQELYENIEQINDFIENTLAEISSDFGITEEELITKIKNSESKIDSLVFSDNIDSVSDESFEKSFVSDFKEIDKSESKNNDNEDETNGNFNTSGGGVNFVPNENNNVNAGNVGMASDDFYDSFTPQDIYDQIGDYIRNLSEGDFKEIALQLHPESLGTVQIRVSQREGVISAEMLTQNDNVRNVLESQLIELKQDFEKAGIKVENIEVKVSTNGFDEASQEDSRNEENSAAQREIPHRRINISDYFEDSETEILEDDEKIAVEMMTANGNTLDYQA